MMSKNRAGFTIIELLIATSIFSVVLLVALNGFFQIGKLYYKGVTTSQTQASAQKILDDISSSTQFAGSTNITPPQQATGTTSTYYMCLGATRYSYILGGQPVNLSTENPSGGKFGMVRDSPPAASCTNPWNGLSYQFFSPTEMLGSKMRVSQVCIVGISGGDINTSATNCSAGSCTPNLPTKPCTFNNLWFVNLKIAYGDDDIFNSGTASTTNPTCNSTLSNSQYCSVANLQTVINRGYGN